MKTQKENNQKKNNNDNMSCKSECLILMHRFARARARCCRFNSFYFFLIVFGTLKVLRSMCLRVLKVSFIVLKVRDFVLKVSFVVLKVRDFVLKVSFVVLKVRNFVFGKSIIYVLILIKSEFYRVKSEIVFIYSPLIKYYYQESGVR